MQQDLGRKNDELEELKVLENCFTEAERMKREHRLYSQVRHYYFFEIILLYHKREL